MVAESWTDPDAREERRRREEREEAILRAASENKGLIAMAIEADRDARESGVQSWPTLDELEQEFALVR